MIFTYYLIIAYYYILIKVYSHFVQSAYLYIM